MASPQFICIEGNIGAGKSTLAHLLARHYDARLILEEFADNTFLRKFYRDAERYAFPLELSFLADRYKQLKDLLPKQELFDRKIISDYVFTKSKLFARVNLKEDEYELFQKLFDIIDLHLPAPDLLVYLNSPVAQLQQNIRRRGRDYEQEIPDEYLDRVQAVYSQFLLEEQQPMIIVDMSATDFVGAPGQLQELVRMIEDETRPVVSYFSS